ncbi:MAG TPA: glutamate synthase subunit alpha, partial [Roseiflexaceae bacterium]|nr:glutamate synthase subunit alpha [Roseiflexaceae bacterium]
QGLDNQGLEILSWRPVPTNDDAIGERALETKPAIEQALIGWRGTPPADLAVRERKLYLARKQIEAAARAEQIETFYFSSFSGRTLVYKGMLVAPMLPVFYPDLADALFESAIAVYHQRYSTNTFPKWELAQPFRMLSHNGEINTLHGNLTWMQAREAEWRAAPAGNSLAGGGAFAAAVMRVGQVIDTSGSDSAILDNALELAVQGGRDVRHALAMLVPEAWEQVSDMDPAWRAFYQYHASLVEPWDGPAALTFCDGDVVGLALDRNGLRPARFLVTSDGLVVCGSEVGCVSIDEARITYKGKVGPGQMIAVDLHSGTFQENNEIKSWLANRKPYANWLEANQQVLAPSGLAHIKERREPESLSERASRSPMLGEQQRAFGYTA